MAIIMVVDDEPDIVIVVQLMLEKEGHKVYGASNGREALQKLVNVKPDLILLDIMMPELDGWETLKLIREREEFKRVPVSMLTAKPLSPEITSRKDIDELVDYIPKPISKEVLINKVHEILRLLEDIARKKEELSTKFEDEGVLSSYEIIARAERLHKSMLTTLKDIFDKTAEEEVPQDRKAAILSQEEAIAVFRKRRMEIEEHIE